MNFFYTVCSGVSRVLEDHERGIYSRGLRKLRNGTIRALVKNIATGHTTYALNCIHDFRFGNTRT